MNQSQHTPLADTELTKNYTFQFFFVFIHALLSKSNSYDIALCVILDLLWLTNMYLHVLTMASQFLNFTTI